MSSGAAWPESTFEWEPEDHEHYCGSHWDPFYDSVDEVFGSLDEMISTAEPLKSFCDAHPGLRTIPESWPRALCLAWPDGNRGLAVTVRNTEGQAELANVSPLAEIGNQASIEIRKVHVWSSGAEAQIEGDWGDADVSFFDVSFVANRACYEVGQRCDFALAGIAYKAETATGEKLAWDLDPALAGQIRDQLGLADGEDLELSLEGSSILVRIEEWDRDDYSFRGPVRTVKVFDDWLGQSGWRVTVCVMRLAAEDAELDIFITERAWAGQEPPEVGQDIEGTLWLQGRLLRTS